VERFAVVGDGVGHGAGVAFDHGRVGGAEGSAVQLCDAATAVAADQVDEIAVVAGGAAPIGVLQGGADQVHEGVGLLAGPAVSG
jgi:hypothetical protein